MENILSFSSILYDCETWYLTLGEDHMLMPIQKKFEYWIKKG